jgi:hypothetical protein
MENRKPEIEFLNRDICEHSQLLDNLSLVHLAKNTKGQLQRNIVDQVTGRGIDQNGAWVGFDESAETWKLYLGQDPSAQGWNSRIEGIS